MQLRRDKIWRLTVEFFARQVADGHTPHRSGEFLDSSPGAYREHEFWFENPPSRKDFFNLVNITPWAHNCWNATLIPLLKDPNQQWPIIEMGHKASSTELFDAQGRVVCKLDVRSEDLFLNDRYDPSLFVWTVTQSIVKHFRLGDRDRISGIFRDHSNWIAEEALNSSNHPSDAAIAYFAGEVLVKNGVWTKNKKPKPKPLAPLPSHAGLSQLEQIQAALSALTPPCMLTATKGKVVQAVVGSVNDADEHSKYHIFDWTPRRGLHNPVLKQSLNDSDNIYGERTGSPKMHPASK